MTSSFLLVIAMLVPSLPGLSCDDPFAKHQEESLLQDLSEDASRDQNSLLQHEVRKKDRWAPSPPPSGGSSSCKCTNPPNIWDPSTFCPLGQVCSGGCCVQATASSIADAASGAASGTPPNPFFKPTGQALPDMLLGFDLPSYEVCQSFLQEMMNSITTLPSSAAGAASATQAVQQMTQDLLNGQNYTQAFGCMKYAMIYADKHYMPEECVLSDGSTDPACCVYEKRCSTTNKLDGCPWTVFGTGATTVDCVGSAELSPVPMGVCKCKVGTCGPPGQGCSTATPVPTFR
eukprot:TRINITY_DN19703_c0_g1_i1.p1 TRINITY_DN19703_c0_g1~~TRINITY_DN19703_c0_g1_i1.p1  ORF type:complete len:289 (-),score=44.21 TRINITY_DN19703_c0_g1_i1:223-1089(-)